MVSTNISDGFHLRGKTLNKRKRFHQPENPFPIAGKTASAVRNLKNLKKIGLDLISSIEPTSIKKVRMEPQSLRLIENPFPLVRMKDLLKNAISLDRKATSSRVSILKKMKKTVSFTRNSFFVNIGLPLIAIMVSKKISSALNRKSVTTGCNKGFF